jgi:hypothetical protein
LNLKLDEMIQRHELATFKSVGNGQTIQSYYSNYLFPVITSNTHVFETGRNFDHHINNAITLNLTFSGNPHNYEVQMNRHHPAAHFHFWKDLKKAVEILYENTVL